MPVGRFTGCLGAMVLGLSFHGRRSLMPWLTKFMRMKTNGRLFRVVRFLFLVLGGTAGTGVGLRAEDVVEAKAEPMGTHTITFTMQGVSENFQQEMAIGTVTMDLAVQCKLGKDGSAALEVAVNKPLIGQTGNHVVVADDGKGKRLTGPVSLKGRAEFVPDATDRRCGTLKLTVQMFDGGMLEYQQVFEYRVALQRTSEGPPAVWKSSVSFAQARGEGVPAEEGKWGTFQKIGGHHVFGVKIESKCGR
jgi:hypothetical protein